MKTITTNYQLIQAFAEAKELRLLSYYYYFKSVYANGTFYDYNENSMAKKAGVSRDVIRRWVNELIDKGLASKHKGNISLESWSNVHEAYECSTRKNIKIKSGKAKEILRQLEYHALEYKLKQQQHIISLKRTLKTTTRSRDVKKSKKKLLSLGYNANESETKVDEDIKLSLSKISSIFSCSISNARRLVLMMQESGRLSIVKAKREYKPYSKQQKQLIDFMVRSGEYRRPCNRYILNGVG